VSGSRVGEALQRRFEDVRRAELERLHRKLSALTPADRQSAEAIIADVIRALACAPAAALARDHQSQSLDAVVHLFGLDMSGTHPGATPPGQAI
jgi:hypothetical protein